MWQLIINSPDHETKLVELKPGKITLGRADTNDIVVDDISASRQHAEIVFDSATNTISLIDLNSTNGTYVNHLRITGTCQLIADDEVNIGQFLMQLQRFNGEQTMRPTAGGTHPLTRELLLEAMYKNSIQIYDTAIKLNSVFKLDIAVEIVNGVLTQSLGLNYCEIILADRLNRMSTRDFMDPLASMAARSGSAEVTADSMFIPINIRDELVGLICMTKAASPARPFNQRDLQLAIALSHQAALVIQRMQLLERASREDQARRLMLGFVSPAETEHLLNDFYEHGELPGLKDIEVTVLIAEIINSTDLAQNLGTEHFSKILSGFYRVASQTIFAQKGMAKYSGDGVLAVFTEHEGEPSGAETAIATGRELINMLNHTGSLDPKQRINIGISINTGNAMVGYVGTRERAEFNVLGDTVTVAYRMRKYFGPYKIIVGPATMAASADKYRFKEAGDVYLYEDGQAIQVYELLP